MVVLAPYWSGHPGVYEGVLSELTRDHRVVSLDARGTGKSSRAGPYDMHTDCADLEAILEDAGGQAVVIATADGANRAVHVAARRPDLVAAAAVMGAAPFARTHFEGSEGMVASDAVVDAMLEMAETDYRSALRSLVTATNPQMSEEQLRDRVRVQAEHSPAEAAVPRLRAWVEADSIEEARAIGDRLWILHWDAMGGGWFPTGRELESLIGEGLPEAHLLKTDDGMMSRPDQAAAVVRRITTAVRAAGS